MQKTELVHSIIRNLEENRYFFCITEPLFKLDLNALQFSFIGAFNTSYDSFWEELIKGLSKLSCGRVMLSCHILVMAAAVLQVEVTVQDLSVCPHADQFIDRLAFVDKFMAR